MNHYYTSTGERIQKSVIDRRIREAKKQKIDMQLDQYGYNFCQSCRRSTGIRLDCSHIISVDRCQKESHSELAYDINNIQILCRKCHAEYDKNNVQL